jgi:hypothetical protein
VGVANAGGLQAADAAMTAAMRRVRWVGWCSGVVLGLATARASAAEIDWQGPATCPDGAELRFRIERAIGMPLSHAAKLHFQVRAERSTEGYVARMGVDAGPEEAPRRRVLVAPDCSRLADLVAVTAAIALGTNDVTDDLSAASGELARPSDDAAPTPPRAVGAVSAPPAARAEEKAAAPSPGSSAPWSPALSAWLLADSGSLPRPGAGVALGAGVEQGRFQLRALATLLFEEHAALEGVAEPPGPGADLGLVTGALSVCAVPFGSPGSRLGVDGCAGWELGRLSGEGTGVLRPRTDAALWSAPRIDVGVSWALGSTGLELGAQITLALPLVREDFVLGDLGSVHRPSAAVGRASLGLNWRLQ